MPKGDHNRKLSDEQIQEIVRLYSTPAADGTWTGAKTISQMFGVTDTLIMHHLKRLGVRIRTPKEAHSNGKACKPIKNLPPADTSAPFCKCGCGEHVIWNRAKNHYNAYVKGHQWGGAKPVHDPEWLYHQYITLGRSSNDISKEVGIANTGVCRYLRKFGIPIRSGSVAHIGTQAGKNNPAWKGGITPERQRLYKTQTWKEVVKAIFKRDDYLCAKCGRTKGKGLKLHAHHMRSFAEYPELRFDLDNLITLCNECHEWVHSKQNINGDFIE